MTKKARSGGHGKKRLFFLCLFILTALFLLLLWNMRIDTVRVNGTEFYTPQEIENCIFEKPAERNFLYAWLNNRFGQKKSIPFVAGYTMEFYGIHEVEITVYEKSVIGYVNYMGSHMYFDKDGTVVESSSEIREGIPLVTGLTFDYIVLYKTLPVADETTFTQILNLTQLIAKHRLSVDRIHFDSRLFATLYIGDIRVCLGDKTNMEDKLAELVGMLPQLEGLSGELHLEKYDPAAMNPSYTFVPDPAPQDDETETPQGDEEQSG